MAAQEQPELRAIKPQDMEASFRNSLEEVLAVVKPLTPFFNSTDELIDMLEQALINDGQLRFLMNRVIPRPRR